MGLPTLPVCSVTAFGFRSPGILIGSVRVGPTEKPKGDGLAHFQKGAVGLGKVCYPKSAQTCGIAIMAATSVVPGADKRREKTRALYKITRSTNMGGSTRPRRPDLDGAASIGRRREALVEAHECVAPLRLGQRQRVREIHSGIHPIECLDGLAGVPLPEPTIQRPEQVQIADRGCPSGRSPPFSSATGTTSTGRPSWCMGANRSAEKPNTEVKAPDDLKP